MAFPFRPWLPLSPPPVSRDPPAIHAVDAYLCDDCQWIVAHAPHGRCQLCGSSAVASVTGERASLHQRIQTLEDQLAQRRHLIKYLVRTRIPRLLFLLARRQQEDR